MTAISVASDNLCESLLHILSPLQTEKRGTISAHCVLGDSTCNKATICGTGTAIEATLQVATAPHTSIPDPELKNILLNT